MTYTRNPLEANDLGLVKSPTWTISMALGSCAMKGRVINLGFPSVGFRAAGGLMRPDVRSEKRVTRPRDKV